MSEVELEFAADLWLAAFWHTGERGEPLEMEPLEMEPLPCWYGRFTCQVCGHERQRTFPGEVICRVCREIGIERCYQRRCKHCGCWYLCSDGWGVHCPDCYRYHAGRRVAAVRDPFAHQGQQRNMTQDNDSTGPWQENAIRAWEDAD